MREFYSDHPVIISEPNQSYLQNTPAQPRSAAAPNLARQWTIEWCNFEVPNNVIFYDFF